MSKMTAKNTIRSSGLHSSLIARGVHLIDNPDDLDQDAFGICGVVSILRVLLDHSPDKFADIAVDCVKHSKVSEIYQIWVQHRGNNDALLDFLMGHYLIDAAGKASGLSITEWRELPSSTYSTSPSSSITTKTTSGTELIKKQKAFSDLFKNEDPSLAQWQAQGHFALTQTGVAYIMSKIAGAAETEKIAWSLSFGPTLTEAKRVTNGKQTPFILAGIKDAVGPAWVDGAVTETPCKTPAHDEPKFGHWVVINDIQLVDKYYVVDLWTWTTQRTVKFGTAVLRGYIYGLVAGYVSN